jgi:hypothetical protein
MRYATPPAFVARLEPPQPTAVSAEALRSLMVTPVDFHTPADLLSK